jgi:Zn-dependent protease/predicted transcriptional regulator
MGDSIVLGRILGIRVGVNWSLLIVAALITWTLSAAVFPEENPGLSDGSYLAMGIVAAALFFASILAHELGHALQARRDRVEIEGITLWVFGGVAKLAGRIPCAGAELRIAIAGPLVSLVLGLGFAAVAWAAPLPRQVDGVAAWLGYTNLVLLAFNLLPAFPLDGGRVLRAALWARGHDLARATRQAAVVGRALAFGMIGVAVVVMVAGGGLFAGAWLAFIGWFLLQAASAEAQQVTVEERLAGLTVADLMARDPVAVPPGLSLADFVDDVVWRARFTTYPVTEDGVPVGLLPFRCVAQVPRAEWETRRVRDCMVPLERVPRVAPTLPLGVSLPLVAGSEERRALVVDDGRLVGLLSITDLMRALEIGGPAPRT